MLKKYRNSTVSTGRYMLRRLSAARATKNHVRASPSAWFFSATFFCALELLRNSFIAHKKTSHTAGTLSASLHGY